jgi:hypothetical protein
MSQGTDDKDNTRPRLQTTIDVMAAMPGPRIKRSMQATK